MEGWCDEEKASQGFWPFLIWFSRSAASRQTCPALAQAGKSQIRRCSKHSKTCSALRRPPDTNRRPPTARVFCPATAPQPSMYFYLQHTHSHLVSEHEVQGLRNTSSSWGQILRLNIVCQIRLGALTDQDSQASQVLRAAGSETRIVSMSGVHTP